MNIINNEKGVALVLAMVMLVLMSMLGALVVSTSTTEIGISGNYRNSHEAFYAADRAVEYASTDANIYTSAGLLPTGGTVNLNTDNAGIYAANISINNMLNNGLVSGLDTGLTNTVTNLGICAPLVGTGSATDSALGGGEALNYYKHYLINVNVKTITAGDYNPSTFSVESQIARLTPAGCS